MVGHVLHSSKALSDQQATIALQPFLKLLNFQYLIVDSILHALETLSAYNPPSTTIMVNFAVSDIPDLEGKVILVTGGVLIVDIMPASSS